MWSPAPCTVRPPAIEVVRCTVAAALTALLVLLAAFPASSIAAADVSFELALTPDGPPPSEIQLTVPAGSQTARMGVFLRQSGSTALEGAKVVAAPGGPSLTITAADGAATFTVPPAPGVVAMAVETAGITQALDVRVAVFLLASDGTARTLAAVRIVREDAPALTLLGAGADGLLSFDQDRESFTRDVWLRADGMAPVTARLDFTPLQDDTSRQVPLAVAVDGTAVSTGASVELPSGGSRKLTLTATLPHASTYRADLTLAYGPRSASRLAARLVITRRATAQTVVAEPVTAVVATRGPCPLPWSCTATASGLVTFRETKGEPSRLDPLQVREVILVEDAATVVQAAHDDPVITVPAQGAQPVSAVSIPAWGSVVVAATVPGLTRAGSYEVRLRGATVGTDPVDVVMKLVVRDSMLLAAMVILAGTVLSWLLRWWIRGRRGVLGRRVEVDRLARRLEQVLAARSPVGARRDVATRVRAMVTRLAREARLRGDHEQVRAMQADLTERVELLDQWLEVAGVADSGPSHEDVEAALRTARDILLQAGPLTDAARESFADALLEARTLLDAGAALRRRSEVERVLATTQPPPGFDQAGWDARRGADLRRLTEADARGAGAGAATTDLLHEAIVRDVSRGLADRLSSRSRALAANGKDELATRLGGLADRCRVAATRAEAGQPSRALAEYDAVLEEYRSLESDLAAAGVQMGAGPGQAPLELGLVAASPIELNPTQLPDEGPAARTWRAAALLIGDTAAGLVVAVIAVMLGVVALYLPDPTWGSPTDWLTAFLWGMGLYQVGGAASEGIEGVWRTLRGA